MIKIEKIKIPNFNSGSTIYQYYQIQHNEKAHSWNSNDRKTDVPLSFFGFSNLSIIKEEMWFHADQINRYDKCVYTEKNEKKLS